MSSQPKQAFLFLTHYLSPEVIGSFERIVSATDTLGHAYIVFHQKQKPLPAVLQQYDHHLFTDETLKQLNYPIIGQSLVPGHTHFPIFQFIHTYPDFDYYWVIEDDVDYTGDWFKFFDTFTSIDYDFLSCHIRPYKDEPDWWMWDSLQHDKQEIALEQRLRSFNPIYRLSKRAFQYLHTQMSEGWRGHYETLVPTLLNLGGFSIADIGGRGQFVPDGFEERFYISTPSNNFGRIRKTGTMRHRPIFHKSGNLENKLYHPVKLGGARRYYYKKQLTRIARKLIPFW